MPAPISLQHTAPPVALTIAGSDNSSGAGLQADLKTFTAHGVHGLTAVTCVVAEIPGRVTGIQPVPPDLVAEQIRLSLTVYPVAAIKTGMLFSLEIIEAVLATLPAPGSIPLVVDPVMVASSGDRLLREEAIAAYRTHLLPRATLVTPNLDEAAVLLGSSIHSVEEMADAGRALVQTFGTAFLMKGGHLPGGSAIDLLVTAAGITEHAAPHIPGIETHGTGCTFSAAIAAGLACGQSLTEAVASAKQFITQAIARSLCWQPPGQDRVMALNHFAPSLQPS